MEAVIKAAENLYHGNMQLRAVYQMCLNLILSLSGLELAVDVKMSGRFVKNTGSGG